MSVDPPLTPAPDLPEEASDRAIDIEEARRLVEALERDLKDLPGDRSNLAVLEAEIAELRRVLHADDATPEQWHTGLHGMRDRLHDFPDEIKGDAFRAGRYLAELGRILGLG
jgi:hypothetical protein